MQNINCLEGIECPECKNRDAFYIGASITAYVTDEGAQPANCTEYNWDDNSFVSCAQCDRAGLMSEFKIVKEVL